MLQRTAAFLRVSAYSLFLKDLAKTKKLTGMPAQESGKAASKMYRQLSPAKKAALDARAEKMSYPALDAYNQFQRKHAHKFKHLDNATRQRAVAELWKNMKKKTKAVGLKKAKTASKQLAKVAAKKKAALRKAAEKVKKQRKALRAKKTREAVKAKKAMRAKKAKEALKAKKAKEALKAKKAKEALKAKKAKEALKTKKAKEAAKAKKAKKPLKAKKAKGAKKANKPLKASARMKKAIRGKKKVLVK